MKSMRSALFAVGYCLSFATANFVVSTQVQAEMSREDRDQLAHIDNSARELAKQINRFADIADQERVLKDIRPQVRDLDNATSDLIALVRRNPSPNQVKYQYETMDTAFRALRARVRSSRVEVSFRAQLAFSNLSKAMVEVEDQIDTHCGSHGLKDPWVFKGAIDGLDVRFEGADHMAIYDECMRTMNRQNVSRRIESVRVANHTYFKRNGSWNYEAACAIAGLNSGAESGRSSQLEVEGMIDDAPFYVRGRRIKATRVMMETLVPKLGGNVEKLEINGRNYSRDHGTFSLNSVVMVMYANIDDCNADMTVEGVIQDTPFIFQGPSKDNIMKGCVNYVDIIYGNTVRSFTARGRSFSKRDGDAYSSEEVCMTVAARAEDN